MNRRRNKINQCLALVMARLGTGAGLQRVEVETPDGISVLTVTGETLKGAAGHQLPLAGLAAYLVNTFEGVKKGGVRFVERGVLVTVVVTENDATLTISTQDSGDHCQRQVETGTRQHFIKVQEALPLLQALEIASPEGKIRADRRRKYYQVDRFVELVDEVLGQWQEKRPLTILDCGCGKSYLAFVLNYWLVEKRRIPCKVVGIDENEGVIAASQKIQQQLNYRNMEFRQARIMEYQPSGPVDMVLSLHACDTATDEALAQGIHLGCKYIIAVPCCQAALRERLDYRPWQGVAKYNIFRNRLADVLTDGLRASALSARGYRVSVVEYVSPLATPKNIMLRAIKEKDSGDWDAHKQMQNLVQGPLPVENYLHVLQKTPSP